MSTAYEFLDFDGVVQLWTALCSKLQALENKLRERISATDSSDDIDRLQGELAVANNLISTLRTDLNAISERFETQLSAAKNEVETKLVGGATTYTTLKSVEDWIENIAITAEEVESIAFANSQKDAQALQEEKTERQNADVAMQNSIALMNNAITQHTESVAGQISGFENNIELKTQDLYSSINSIGDDELNSMLIRTGLKKEEVE